MPVGAAVAALRPADDREEPVALLVQPGALLAGGEVEVGLGPAARPEVLVAVELRRAHPVLRRELEAVLDAHPALLGAVDEEEAAEAPEGLAAERLLALLVDEHDPLAAVGELGGGDEPGETGPTTTTSASMGKHAITPLADLPAAEGIPTTGMPLRLGGMTETLMHGPLDDQLSMQLLHQRIIVLGAEVDDPIANRITAQLLLLSARDPRADISLYVNSPGGSVTAGLAIYDTMRVIPNEVSTLAVGFAASMGQFLLGAGTPGKRFALPNARIMMHQPSAGIRARPPTSRCRRPTSRRSSSASTSSSPSTPDRPSSRSRGTASATGGSARRRRRHTASSTTSSPRSPTCDPRGSSGRWVCGEQLHDPLRHREDPGGRAQLRHLQPISPGADHLRRHRDRRRGGERRDGAAAPPRLRGSRP